MVRVRVLMFNSVPLRPCRRNLMNVNFGRILGIEGSGTEAETEEIHINYPEGEEASKLSDDLPKVLPDENNPNYPGSSVMSNGVQENIHHEDSHVNACMSHESSAAMCPKHSVPQQTSGLSSHELSSRRLDPPRSTVDQRSGQYAGVNSGSQDSDNESVRKATGCEHSPRVGAVHPA